MLDASSVKNVQSTDDTIIISDFHKNVNRQFLEPELKNRVLFINLKVQSITLHLEVKCITKGTFGM